ncbi:MAG: hypothetical protein IKY62_03470 [Clostridia bacterium]|nr:hypothetical protein [Clostridia bacterium]
MSTQSVQTPENINDEASRTPEVILSEIESAKFEIKALFRQYRSVVKSASLASKEYERASVKSSERPSSRNSVKLSRAQAELESAMIEVRANKARIKDAIQDVVDKYDTLSADFSAEGRRFKAWRYRRRGESFMNTELERLDGLTAPVAMYSSFRETEGRERRPSQRSGAVQRESMREDTVVGTHRPPYLQQPIYFVPAYMDPSRTAKGGEDTASLKDEIKATINEMLSPVIEKLDERISVAVATSQATTPVTPDADAIRESGVSVEEINKLVGEVDAILSSLHELVAGAESITAKSREIAELQKEVIEMQRALAREMQGVQVKQKLVNDGQTELAEAQEITLQHQKLLAEKQSEISEEQAAAVSGAVAVSEAQAAISQTIKEAIQTQKGIISANAKNGELQRELIERQAQIADEQKEILHKQKILSRAVKNAAKANEN